MSDFKLEYLIIYQNIGTPVYSRCFADLCKIAMQNDVLFSAFLSSLSTFATYSDKSDLDKIDLDGITVDVEISDDDKLTSLIMEDLKLIFLYTQTNDYTIAAGFNLDEYKKRNANQLVHDFLSDVEQFMEKHHRENWSVIETDSLLSFESELLRDVIHPFFDTHGIEDKCPFGDNCPIRIALYEEQGSLIDRLSKKVAEYRAFSMMRKIWRMMTGSSYKLTV